MSNFKVTITEAVPDTGLFTSTDNSSGIAIGAGALILLFAAITIVAAIVAKRRNHRNYQKSKFHLRAAKRTMVGLSVLAVMVGAFSLAIARQPEDTKNASATDGSTDTSEDVDDELSIDVSDFELSIVPTKDGTFGYSYQTVKVTTPTDYGYTLMAYASSADLINEKDEENVISGLEHSELYSKLGTNSWGTSNIKPEDADSEVWLRMPEASDGPMIIDSTNSSTERGEISKIYYGVNVNTDLAYGDYTNTIVYTAVANILSIDSMYFMQDFADLSADEKDLVLGSMQIGEQFQLTDNRDFKEYYISKLADGNVWMTQNLDLDLDATKTYTPDDTDITTNWSPSNNTIDFTGSTISGWAGSGTTPESADPGDLYYYTSGDSSNDTMYTSLSACKSAGHSDCEHYHAGNYYNWSAAMASNNSSSFVGEQDINGSICPAGWRLPQGISGEYDMSSLAESYNITAANALTFRNTPIYLTRSGRVDDGELTNQASQGQYWTSAPSGITYAYAMIFSDNYFDAAYTAYRDSGFSIRCILK